MPRITEDDAVFAQALLNIIEKVPTPMLVYDGEKEVVKKALHMLLADQEAETAEDLIERQAVICELNSVHSKYGNDGYVMIYRGDAIDKINALPAKRPEEAIPITYIKQCQAGHMIFISELLNSWGMKNNG